MTAPPAQHAVTQNGITGTRTNAETKRALAARVIRAMRNNDVEPHPARVRTILARLAATGDDLTNDVPTDDEVVRQLMTAPWFPKAARRHWRLGEGGGWATRV